MCLAIPGKIVELLRRKTAAWLLVDVLGVRRKVDLGLLQEDPPVAGDWVLIHVGFAMSKISEEDALRAAAHADRSGRERTRRCEEVRGYGLGAATGLARPECTDVEERRRRNHAICR